MGKKNIIMLPLDLSKSIYDLDSVRTTNISLKDYVHYYLGSRYRIDWPDGDYVEDTLDWIGYGGFIFGSNTGPNKKGTSREDDFEVEIFKDNIVFKFILTHPCDLTKDQNVEYRKLCYPVRSLMKKKEIIRYADTPYSMHYLFKNGIDAFDLIEKGLAIDKKYYINQ